MRPESLESFKQTRCCRIDQRVLVVWNRIDPVYVLLPPPFGPLLHRGDGTALMADPAVKTAVFSPGIAAVLQANYSTLDAFLFALAGNLLCAATEPPAAKKEKRVHKF